LNTLNEDTRTPVAAVESHPAEYNRGNVTSSDQMELVWQSWLPSNPKGVVTIVHGLAEHGGRYQDTAKALTAAGWAVYTVDLRAHGLSPNPPRAGRVHVNRFEDYFRDVDALTGLAAQNHPGLPLFLLGHSMGGLISIRYSLEKPDKLAGVIISSPALGIHPDVRLPIFLKIMVGVLSRLAPRFRVPSDLDTNAISRDPGVVKAYIDDPLISQKVSTRWYAEFFKSIKKANEGAASLRIPMLLMQSGADQLVDPDAPRRWQEEAPREMVDLVVWDGLFHEMLNEPEKVQVRARLLDWLETQLSRLPSPAAS
jgi:alpha-beta hydrolase superfamily lysophospholipase